MGKTTEIAWTDHTFNPWIGCTKVSEGCKNCYAKTRDDRHMLEPVSHWGPGAPRHVTSASNWKEPAKWAKAARHAGIRERVFCASLADVFDKEAPVSARQDLWKLIGDTYDALDWQLLTKRPENILPVMCDDLLNLGFFELAHCWLGTSTENQAAADERIPLLLQTPAAVHFISAEPLLGSVTLPYGSLNSGPGSSLHRDQQGWCDGGLEWVICGGESGPGARPMYPDWARSLRDQCQAAGVPFFFKQWGEYWPNEQGNYAGDESLRQLAYDEPGEDFSRVGKKAAGALLDGREWKQFPEVRHG
jgi:protein gp37